MWIHPPTGCTPCSHLNTLLTPVHLVTPVHLAHTCTPFSHLYTLHTTIHFAIIVSTPHPSSIFYVDGFITQWRYNMLTVHHRLTQHMREEISTKDNKVTFLRKWKCQSIVPTVNINEYFYFLSGWGVVTMGNIERGFSCNPFQWICGFFKHRIEAHFLVFLPFLCKYFTCCLTSVCFYLNAFNVEI